MLKGVFQAGLWGSAMQLLCGRAKVVNSDTSCKRQPPILGQLPFVQAQLNRCGCHPALDIHDRPKAFIA
jgi:hypothetical protein